MEKETAKESILKEIQTIFTEHNLDKITGEEMGWPISIELKQEGEKVHIIEEFHKDHVAVGVYEKKTGKGHEKHTLPYTELDANTLHSIWLKILS
jgi:hypothetical protein